MSRSSSSTSLSKMSKPPLKSKSSGTSLSAQFQQDPPTQTPSTSAPTSETSSTHLTVPSVAPSSVPNPGATNLSDDALTPLNQEDDLKAYTIPLQLKNKDRWEDKHSPELYIKAKYMPYPALRQQFWRVMLKQYDADDSARISKVELTTMLDTLGSTLKDSTIDGFFRRFAAENEPSETVDLTFDQAVICLEEKLQELQKKSVRDIGSKVKNLLPGSTGVSTPLTQEECEDEASSDELSAENNSMPASNTDPERTAVPGISSSEQTTSDELSPDDLADERGEEHVVEIRECPLCHQPRLGKRSDADIITHIATCASQDWRQVDNLMMGGFVTSSQAQRKWYSKVITKISYGGYKLGANSANILVQDRITGQINEERMSVYVRLGIRLLYKGLKSREMEKKRSMSR